MRLIKVLILLSILPLLLLVIMVSSQHASKKMLRQEVLPKYDIIVVPGVPFEKEVGKWSKIMEARVKWSVYLYNLGVTENIMFTGSAVYSPYVEAKIMTLYAEALGVPSKNIFTESKAEHSTENIYYSYKHAQNLGFKKIALTTDPFQSIMLKRFIKANNLKVDRLPVLFKKVQNEIKVEPIIDYQKAFVEDFTSIKEKEGFFERFKGTLGQKIDTTAYVKSFQNAH